MIVEIVALVVMMDSRQAQVAKTSCFKQLSTMPAPSGFRYPVESDVSANWQYYRDEYNRQASCTRIDLNGDGVMDYVSFALRTDGPGFSVVVLYSGKGQYEPRIVWTDSGQIYRAVDGRVETAKRGPRTPYFGCDGWDEIKITLPAAAIDYFTRPPPLRSNRGTKRSPSMDCSGRPTTAARQVSVISVVSRLGRDISSGHTDVQKT